LHYTLFTNELQHLEQDDMSELEHVAYTIELPWILDPTSWITDIQYDLHLDLYALIMSDGRAYAVKELSQATSGKVKLVP
jgi:hypothetical protein